MSTDIVEIPLPDYKIRVIARRGYERNPAPRVYVADAVGDARSDTLVDLKRQEKALGERRFAERGQHDDVDALYDRLNAEIMRVKLEIAKEALGELGHVITGDVIEGMERAFFSRHAGCDMCPCSPGVVAGVKLEWQGAEFDVWVEEL